MLFKEIFTTKKIIQSKILNIIGLQIFRYLLSKSLYVLSKIFTQHTKVMKNYSKDGYVLINNFLDKEEYYELKNEFEKIISERGKNIYDNANEFYKKINSSINHLAYELKDINEIKINYPNIYKFYNNVNVNKLFRIAERKKKSTCICV